MKQYRLILLLVAIFFATSNYAQTTPEEFDLKDGRTLNGYISYRDLEKRQFEITLLPDSADSTASKTSNIIVETVLVDNIVSIRKKANSLNPDGVIDVIKIKDGSEYKGLLSETIVGLGFRFITDKGKIMTIKNSEVASYRKYVNNGDILSKSEYHEIITTYDGNKFEGLVIETKYPIDGEVSKIIALSEGGTKEIPNKSIKTISVVLNPTANDENNKSEEDSRTSTNSKMDEKHFYVCGESQSGYRVQVRLNNIAYPLSASSSDPTPFLIHKDEVKEITIEFLENELNSDILFLRTKKNGKKYGFDCKSVESDFSASSEIKDPNGIVIRTYSVPEVGNYVFYNKKQDRVYWIEIK